MMSVDSVVTNQAIQLQRYYQFHAKIYDYTRWSFLFGRTDLINVLVRLSVKPTHILEVGCGTGQNLADLVVMFPRAHLTGLDISANMLTQAQNKLQPFTKRVSLIQMPYQHYLTSLGQFDLILFSYTLTMLNPGWEQAIAQAYQDLAPGGLIAVVDFHDSSWPAFKRWMRLNHVRLDGHLLPYLTANFEPCRCAIQSAYFGLWHYLTFIGQKTP